MTHRIRSLTGSRSRSVLPPHRSSRSRLIRPPVENPGFDNTSGTGRKPVQVGDARTLRPAVERQLNCEKQADYRVGTVV